MAKNDPLPTVSFQRKDTFLLFDGTWYVSTPCVTHGLVDEEVPWAEAKTPHHAGLIADQRHAACFLEADKVNQRAEALAEIEAARIEVTRVEGLLNQARENLKRACEQYDLPATVKPEMLPKPIGPMFAQLLHQVALHEHGVGEARQRLENTTRANADVG